MSWLESLVGGGLFTHGFLKIGLTQQVSASHTVGSHESYMYETSYWRFVQIGFQWTQLTHTPAQQQLLSCQQDRNCWLSAYSTDWFLLWRNNCELNSSREVGVAAALCACHGLYLLQTFTVKPATVTAADTPLVLNGFIYEFNKITVIKKALDQKWIKFHYNCTWVQIIAVSAWMELWGVDTRTMTIMRQLSAQNWSYNCK